MKLRNGNNRISHIVNVGGVYWHVQPYFGDITEKQTKIGTRVRSLERYMKRKNLKQY